MRILKIWNGSPERDIIGLKDFVRFAVVLALLVWLWGSIFRWAGYTLGFLCVAALFGLACWWIAKKTGDENGWHLVLGIVVAGWILIEACLKLLRIVR